ncbi:hypothetical protein [Vulgatibacter sp.]|uniref:hypothetical protein n=1 Tax=Vulgatibacter sp. TaxID=1971226 RepID=UPI003564F3C9
MRTHVPWYVPMLLLVVVAACGGSGGGTPNQNPDPCAGVTATCATDADCSGGATCSGCGVCEGGEPGCSTHTQCAEGKRCIEGACAPGGCTETSCGDAEVCNPSTRLCEVRDCNRDGCPGDLRCKPEAGTCHECLLNSHCIDEASPWCDVSTGTCVGCRGDPDCNDSAAGNTCRMADQVCVTCLDDGACNEAAPRCDADGQCRQCIEDADCPGSRCLENGTCWAGPVDGETCREDGSCAAGFLCMEGENVCKPACNPFEPACPTGRVCTMLEADGRLIVEDGVPVAACLPDAGGAPANRACDKDENACRVDLYCMPDTPSTGFCRRYCDPSGPDTCGTGLSCHEVPMGGAMVGVCSPSTSWMRSCVRDTDCAFNQGCKPLDDGSGVPGGRCDWSPGNARAAEACDDDGDCRSGFCFALDGAGNGHCFGGCAGDADCTATNAFCAELPLSLDDGTTGGLAACQPRCANDAGCSAFGDAVCNVVQVGVKLEQGCTALGGPSDAGGGDFCTADDGCATGTCIDNARGEEPATAGFCLGSCFDAGDCSVDTTCREVAFRTSPDRAEPETWDTAQVCWGASCTGDANCPEGRACTFEPDPRNPTAALRTSCNLAVGELPAGSACTLPSSCSTGTCERPQRTSWSVTKENCTNGWNDDWWQDSAADCSDTDCMAIYPCAAAGERCDDGIDNDGDGLADCQDPDCSNQSTCAEICTDGIDNDGDGLVDCDDGECAFLQSSGCSRSICLGPCATSADCAYGTSCRQRTIGGLTLNVCDPA